MPNLARPYIREGHELAMELNNPAQLHQCYKALAHLESSSGNYKSAYDYQQQVMALSDSLLNEEISEQALRIDELSKYENIQQEQQIQLLAANNEIKDLQIQRSRRKLILLLIFAAALVMISFIIFMGKRRVDKLNETLAKQKEVINKSLKEKEFLIKEIHHRVKNNLQVISSLLKLQSRNIEDESARTALNVGRSRVRSMALIHKNLYMDERNLNTIPIRKYIEDLSTEVIETYNNLDQTPVNIELDVDDLNLDVDILIPIGLIINELLSNSLKYAFHAHLHPKVSISLKIVEENLVLKVSDNGIGYRSDQISAESFGLKLVRAFSDRLGAEYLFESDQGTSSTFIIKNFNLAA